MKPSAVDVILHIWLNAMQTRFIAETISEIKANPDEDLRVAEVKSPKPQLLQIKEVDMDRL